MTDSTKTKTKTKRAPRKAAAPKMETREVYKPDSKIDGTPLFALTVANLRLCGLFAPKSTATAGAILAPYASDTMIKHHKGNGNIERDAATGRYSLTEHGKSYFGSRADGSRSTQQVSEEMIAAATKALTGGGEFAGVKFSQKITVKI